MTRKKLLGSASLLVLMSTFPVEMLIAQSDSSASAQQTRGRRHHGRNGQGDPWGVPAQDASSARTSQHRGVPTRDASSTQHRASSPSGASSAHTPHHRDSGAAAAIRQQRQERRHEEAAARAARQAGVPAAAPRVTAAEIAAAHAARQARIAERAAAAARVPVAPPPPATPLRNYAAPNIAGATHGTVAEAAAARRAGGAPVV
ncbi:MAG: hypothetical protein LBJ70_00595, partial [Holosporales bacterium]|nr:hypothetical protein [Holosporales bacterium]